MFEQNWLHSIIWNVSELLLRDDVHRVVFQKSEVNYTNLQLTNISMAWKIGFGESPAECDSATIALWKVNDVRTRLILY